MEHLLEDETAVITGGASGFGREIALTFADQGADVIVADIREDPREGGEPTHERIESETDRRAHYVECDVTNPADLEVTVDAADELGGLDIMVNNAGITNETDFLEVTEEEYDQLMSINLKGVFFGCQAAGKKMVDAGGGGKIINMSSAGAYRAMADISTYCASKAAVRTLTYALTRPRMPLRRRRHPGQLRQSGLQQYADDGRLRARKRHSRPSQRQTAQTDDSCGAVRRTRGDR